MNKKETAVFPGYTPVPLRGGIGSGACEGDLGRPSSAAVAPLM